MGQPLEFKGQMTKVAANINDATTGHKLQGIFKDVMIVTLRSRGGLFRILEYVALYRVHTLCLYLFGQID